jgi:protein KTI12
VRTPHYVVHIGTPVSQARGINNERLAIRGAEAKEEDRPYESEC